MRQKSWFYCRALAVVLFLLYAVSHSLQFYFQVIVNGDTLSQFAASTFENLQSEFLQLLTQVLLPVWFLYVGSPASRDGQDRLERKVDALLQTNPEALLKLRELEAEHAAQSGGTCPEK